MRIAFVTETWWPSTDGVVTRLTATVRELRKLGHDLLIVAPSGGEPEFEGIPVKSVPNVRVSFIYGGKPWGLPVPRVGRYLDAFAPDLVHVVNPFVIGVAGVLHANRRRWPLVASYHTNIARYAEFYQLGFTKPLIWAILRALHNRAALNLSPSQAVKDDIEGHGIQRVALWDRGVDIDAFHPRYRSEALHRRFQAAYPNAPVLLYVGRLAAEKGIDRLRQLFDAGVRVNLVLVGDGPERAQLERDFHGTPTLFTGILHGQALAEAYASSDLFVFPSTTDTLGLVVLEAMACGLPVLAADSLPTHELLDESGAGLIFRPAVAGDLVHRVQEFLLGFQETGTVSFRDNARREAEKRAWGPPTRKLATLYQGLCQAAPAAPAQRLGRLGDGWKQA